MRLGESEEFRSLVDEKLRSAGPDLARLIEIPPTEQIAERASEFYVELAALPDDQVLARTTVKDHIDRLERLMRRAVQRDELQADRPDGCWCLGLGGKGITGIYGNPDALLYREYCDCDDGQRTRSEHDEIRAAARQAVLQARLDLIYREARIPPAFDGLVLETFPDQALVERLRKWLATENWLVLTGPVGTGKTGLALGLLIESGRFGASTLFVNVPDFMALLRSTYDPSSADSENHVIQTARSADVLVLDDLGAERGTEWATEILYRVIRHRHDYRRRTILTTNLEPRELFVRLGDRLASRVFESAQGIVLTEVLRGRK